MPKDVTGGVVKDKIAEAVEAVRGSDLAIVAVGTRSTYLGRSPKYSTTGEGFDLSSLELPGVQEELLQEIENRKTDGCRIDSRQTINYALGKRECRRTVGTMVWRRTAGTFVGGYPRRKGQSVGTTECIFPRSTDYFPCFYNHFITDRNEPFDQPEQSRRTERTLYL